MGSAICSGTKLLFQSISKTPTYQPPCFSMRREPMLPIQTYIIQQIHRNYMQYTNIGLKTRGNIILNSIWLNVTWTDGLCVYSLSSNIGVVHFSSQIILHNRNSSSCEDRTRTVTMVRKAGICEWDGTGLHSTFQSLSLFLTLTHFPLSHPTISVFFSLTLNFASCCPHLLSLSHVCM